jgi:ABC-type transport system substrate-binding protein
MDNYWLRKHHISRRGVLGAAGAGFAGLALVGCGDDDDAGGDPTQAPAGGTTPGAQPTSAIKRGGELTLPVGALGAQPMDPHISLNKAFQYWGAITDRMIEGHPNTVAPLQGTLIEKWEQPDAQTLIFSARPNVKWHEGKITNGRAFTAEDIAYNINRIAGKFDPTRVALFQRATLLLGLDKTEVIDASKVKVTLSQPNAAFLSGLADFRQYAVPKEGVDKDPDFQKVADFAGTGAWIFQSYDETTSTGTYIANKNYWRTGQPYADKFKQVVIADATAGAAAFVSKQIPLAAMNVNSEPIIKAGRQDYKRESWEHIGWEYFRLNQTRAQFADPRVRKAIHLAINRAELGDSGHGPGNWDYTGTLPSGLPGTWTAEQVKTKAGYNPTTKAADIAEGLKLLEAAGFPKGKGVSFTATPFTTGKLHDDVIRIKDQLGKAYPDMTMNIKEPSDAADHAKKLGTADFDAINYTSFPAPDAGLEANQHYGLKGGRNYSKYDNKDVESLIQKTFTELNTAARNEVINQIQQKLFDDIFILTSNKPRPLYAVDSKLRGWDASVHGAGSNSGYDVPELARLMWLA